MRTSGGPHGVQPLGTENLDPLVVTWYDAEPEAEIRDELAGTLAFYELREALATLGNVADFATAPLPSSSYCECGRPGTGAWSSRSNGVIPHAIAPTSIYLFEEQNTLVVIYATGNEE